MLEDCIIIILASITSALLAEGISWLLVYRTASYQALKTRIERRSKKLERQREESAAGRSKSRAKRVEREEEALKAEQSELQQAKMKNMLAVGFTMMAFMGLLSSAFDGVVVARLPFEPFSLIRGLSHRNLPGDDFTECSMIFLYVMCSLSIRPNVQKLLGLSPPRSAQSGPSWMQPPAK